MFQHFGRFNVRRIDREVLKLIHRDASLSQERMAEILKCNRTTIYRAIKRLQVIQCITIVSGGGRVPYDYEIQYSNLPGRLREQLDNQRHSGPD
jgi:predicted transcriptional regulator